MKLPDSIHSRMRLTYIALATIPLLIVGLALTWTTYTAQRSQVLDLQQELAQRVATQVDAFMQSLETNLTVTARVSELVSHPRSEQEQILGQLRTEQSAFLDLVLLDERGQEVVRSSYLGIVTENDLQDRSAAEEFLAFQNNPQTQIYYSPVRFDPDTNAPLMTIAIPLESVQSGTVSAVLVAEVGLKEVSNLIDSVDAGEEGNVYIVDQSDRVIAHRNPSIVFQGTSFDAPAEKGSYTGLLGDTTMLMGVDRRLFGEQEFTIVAEAPVSRAFELAVRSWIFILGLVIITGGAAAILALLASNHINRPIQLLVAVAERIRQGDLAQQAAASDLQELNTLANAFNGMTAELRQTLAELEQRVAARTQALQSSAEVSRYLSTILDTNQLVAEVAGLVQSAFNYYHVNIYLLDEPGRDLILAAATGEAGRMLLANHHRIPGGKGLVGRAAGSNSPVLAANVRLHPDWLPNTLLPETKAEMVVPIARGAEVLGVLDIQHDVIAGLGQGDEDLVQSIANQLAVALLNAQSFEQLVTEKLAEARQKEEAEERLEAYRRSPVGQAERFAQQLLGQPETSLPALHQLTDMAGRNLEAAAMLGHLPKLLEETDHPVAELEHHDVALLANVAEGYNYLFTSQNSPKLLPIGLRTLTEQLERPSTATWQGAAEALAIYQFCQLAVEAATISQITQLDLQRVMANTTTTGTPLAALVQVLAELQSVIEALVAYERVNTSADKLAYLVSAVEWLRHAERQARTKLGSADVSIILRIAENWQAVVAGALSDLQTQARISCRLLTRHTWQNNIVSLTCNVRNHGRGAALNLRINLLPSPAYTLLDEAAGLAQLAPGEEDQVELRISPQEGNNLTQFRVRFVVLYDDPRGPNQSEQFADVVQLLAEPSPFQYIPNPYIVGTPLEAGSALFSGRDELFTAVQENLSAAHCNNLVFIGQRRMGKTSLLKQLRLRLGPTSIPIYLDGQVMGLDPGLANFFLNLATEITFALEDHGIVIPLPRLQDFEDSPALTFEHSFLAGVLELIGQRHLLILFDEFEELEGAVRRGHLDDSIFGYLRHLMQHLPALSFIFCGTHRLEELAADYWHVLFNISLYQRVGHLSHSEAMQLIQQPVAAYGMQYDDLALDKMWRLTTGHPYYLQLLCHSLVNHHNKSRRNYVSVADVNVALEEILSAGEAHFIYLWTESSLEERMTLVAISRLIPLTGSLHAAQVVDYLVERGLSVEHRAIRDALHRLMLRDLLKVEEVETESIYRWQLGLLGLWVEKYKSLGRVVDEVGR